MINNAQSVIENDLNYMADALQEELQAMSGKKLLIVGGAGFLGYYMIKLIAYWNKSLSEQNKIGLTVFDSYARGMPDWLIALEKEEGFSIIKHDITQPIPNEAEKFHYIIHAASIASPTYYRLYPIETMDANVNGLRNLLDYCLKIKSSGHHIEGFLFFSTSEIYGDPSPDKIPTDELYRGYVSCTGPRACYDESKRYGETLCVNFSQQHHLPIKIARPFNNYGPGLKISDRRVLPDFARNIFAGENINMLSDGKPSRTFCYISDAIIGYYKILIRGRSGEAYNIGTEKPEITMSDFAQQVVLTAKYLFGYTGKVIFKSSNDKDYLTDNPNRRCPNISKARQELGYHPTVGIEEGIKRSLIWYNENRSASDA